MTDYGAGRAARKGLSLPAIAAGGVVLIAIFLVGSWLLHRPYDIRKAQQWAISGPPCQQAPLAVFQGQPVKIHERFENDGINFGRGYGHVSCDDIVNDGGKGFGTFTECQFTSPGALQITTKAGDVYFLTGTGPATVTVKKDAVSCVLAGKFRGEQSVPGE